MLRIEPVATSLCGVISGVLGHFKIRAPQKQVTVSMSENLPLIMVDPDRLSQVLDNLLDNALKYTPPQSSLWIDCAQSEDVSTPMVRITVRDDGPGISEPQIDRIFEPFHQSDHLSTDQRKGAGLGLAISRRIIDAHHGRIWAESVTGGGVTFIITLPVVRKQNADSLQ